MTALVFLPTYCMVEIGRVTHVLRYDWVTQKLALFFHEHFVRYLTDEEHAIVAEYFNDSDVEKSGIEFEKV